MSAAVNGNRRSSAAETVTATLYDLLGVARSATAEQIKSAFRRKAKTAHPDAKGGSNDKYRALVIARDVLSDPDRRSTYDKTGKAEEPPRDNTDAEAMKVISGMITVILSGEATVDVASIDAVQAIRDTIKKRVAEIEKQLRVCVQAQARITRIRGRFVPKKKGDTMIERMLDWHAEQIVLSIEMGNAHLKNHRRAIELLDGFSFKTDAPQRPGGFYVSSSTW